VTRKKKGRKEWPRELLHATSFSSRFIYGLTRQTQRKGTSRSLDITRCVNLIVKDENVCLVALAATSLKFGPQDWLFLDPPGIPNAGGVGWGNVRLNSFLVTAYIQGNVIFVLNVKRII